jgi:hypothetical protein
VDDIVVVSKVKGRQEFRRELPHNPIWDPALWEHGSEAPQRFSHELKHKADMCSVGPLVFEIVDDVAHKLVPGMATVTVTKMGENLPLKDVLVCAIAGGTKHLERPEFVLIIVAAARFSCG